MSEGDRTEVARTADVPVARVERAPRRVSWAWAVPIVVVALVVVLVAVQASRARGPRIEITFNDAAGLEPGADLVHRGIRVGVVRKVELTPDLSSVRVEAELAPHASELAREGTQFWIVRPEVSLHRVGGLETLLGPRYVAVRPGDSDAARARRFVGLERPPPAPGSPGLSLTLRADRAGSLSPGSPIFYRGMRVGSVNAVRLASDGASVEVSGVVEAPYDRLVRTNSRFWLSGGVGVDFGLFRGLTVEAESLERLVEGSVSFATPSKPGDRVGDGQAFELASQADEDWLKWSPSIPLGTGAGAP